MSDTNKTVFGELRATFVRGAVVIIPLVLTFWFFRALLNGIDGILSPLLEQWVGREVPGLGFISMLVLILLMGLLSRNLVGRIVFTWFDRLLGTIPFVRAVHGAIRDLIDAFTIGGKGKTFRQVVLVEYPRPGLFTIAFVTNEMTFHASSGTAMDFVNVYIPNPPNPTSGILILVPKKDLVVLDLSIEQGLKLVLSGGIVTPDVLAQKSLATT
ncbi:MAG: DUF502 domain-containing protein [Bacteroidota bacterium]